MGALLALAAGLLFGAGLALGGMTDPAVVLGFLDVAGTWNPTLVFVMGGGLAVTFLGYRLAFRRQRPWLAGRFILPTATAIDARLLGGAALFGIGWGLAGYCPGPALASLPALHGGTAVFVGAMLVGLGLSRQARPGALPLDPAPARSAPSRDGRDASGPHS
jgi:uncharacterized membrane protein YedE/YeeE